MVQVQNILFTIFWALSILSAFNTAELCDRLERHRHCFIKRFYQLVQVQHVQVSSSSFKFYLVTHNTYYVHFITSVVTEEIL